MKKVTDKGGPDYVPPADRIAVFDNDGNLWAEKPVYFQLLFAIDRVKALAPEHPEWNDQQPFKAAIEDLKDMTLTVMAHSLVYWAQGLVRRGLMGQGGRIYAMTSSGGDRVIPSYGAVSAAKASLESHCRQLALELAPYGITANSIRAGVTDTPALRKIPGAEQMIEEARQQNPYGRLTTPEDVARCMVSLADEGTAWMTGNVIRVDGGEDFVGSMPSTG